MRMLSLILLCALAGCHTPLAPDSSVVSQHLTQRVGQSLSGYSPPGQVVFPPGASLDDGLTEDEAIAIALWNNAAFQELLVDLGLARADLITAGLLPNPEFLMYFGVPDKPLRYLFDFPIESLWLRPIRIASAAREADRVSERLTQAGLDLMRDVRQAYADVLLAKDRVRVAGESVTLRGRIAEFAEVRLQAGDISPQETATAQIDALQAQQDAARIAYDIPIFEERLRNLMGIGPMRGVTLRLDPLPPSAKLTFDVDSLTQEAVDNRPDAIAARAAIVAAEARVQFARLGWVRFLGIGDATAGRATGHEFGPALRLTVPFFNQNQGLIARAEAELERAVRNQQTVAYQIILDVQRSYLQYRQACVELDFLLTKVRPEVELAVKRSQAAYKEGNVAIFIVLESTRQLLDNYLREAVLQGDLRRFLAELERSVGRRIATPETAKQPPPPTLPEPQPVPEKPMP